VTPGPIRSNACWQRDDWHIGQSRVVWFFVLSCIYGGLPVALTFLSGPKISVVFAIAWCAFVLLTITAAWYLYVSKKAGWYLSLIVALSWIAGLIAGVVRLSWNLFTIVMTVGMAAVLIWLFLPSVTEHFGVKI
jgi:hypothetical protein